jgi:hypothetical protein
LATSQQDAIYIGTNSITAKIRNCIFHEIARCAVNVQNNTGITAYVHGCTGVDLNNSNAANHGGLGWLDNGSGTGSIHCVNSYMGISTSATSKWAYTGRTAGTVVTLKNCGMNDASLTGAPGITDNGNNLASLTQGNQIVANADPYDLHTKSGADLLVAGVDLSTDSNLAVTDDIDYAARPTTNVDIGADQLSTAVAKKIRAGMVNVGAMI